MNYVVLTADDMQTLTAERVRALEADHYRARLRLTEALPEEQAAIVTELEDLQRRIESHLTPSPSEADSDATSEVDGDVLPTLDAGGATDGNDHASEPVGPAQ